MGILNEKQLEDIRILQQECERGDFTLKLNWETLRSRNGVNKNDYLHYEGLKLVGFLGLYEFGSKVEMCGMVHPDFRRQGIFTKLMDDAMRNAMQRDYKLIILNSPAHSHSGKGFLKQLPCEFAFSEFQMKWSQTELDDYEDAVVRPSRSGDEETEIQLDIQCFQFTEKEARDYYQRILYEATLKTMIIEKDGRAVGKIRVDHSGREAWIYGFSIFPKYQGSGLGTKVLKKIVAEQCQPGYDIFLEVEATNAHALRLYESCGFKTIQRQDYYSYKLQC
ncbi:MULTISPECIES: GNAT family N-acetyltransferase [unclassified Peribacillus]|uniref:GNAT family N-acetyltransferase n=1 Tax=unclassified Peribacillus TaxID=2675266 RepID=UPI001E33935A|nr:GNAT family N-acetyltransferase [Peribacillus sp. Bi96]